jgi:hypothetical protein
MGHRNMRSLPPKFGTHIVNAGFFIVFASLSAFAQNPVQPAASQTQTTPPAPTPVPPPAPVAAPSVVNEILQHTNSAPLPTPTTTPVAAPVTPPTTPAPPPAPPVANPAPAQAAPATPPVSVAPSQPFTASQAYRECTQLAGTDPQAALVKAEGWLAIDHSLAAHHCRAMALYGLKQFEEAGAELDTVRTKIPEPEIQLRTYVARQGSRAWIQGGKPQQAIDVLSAQIHELTMSQGDNVLQAKLATELLLDRSRIRVEYGQLAQAVQDLDQAISLSPGNEMVLLQRAKIFAQLGDTALAQQDLQVVLRINSQQKEAAALMRVLRDQQLAK